MAAWNSSQPRIEALRARWDRDPSSRLSLQLAEEYRRSGDLDQALHVLRKGIEATPSIAAEVALGRCLLEANDLAAAKVHLGRAIERDPTQMVAYRHLIEVHTRLGDPSEARSALDIYRQLNPTDPDLGELSARVAETGSAEAEAVSGAGDASVTVQPQEAASPPPAQSPPPSAVETASFRPLESTHGAGLTQDPPPVTPSPPSPPARPAAPFVSFLDQAEDEAATTSDVESTSQALPDDPPEGPPSRFGFAGEWQPSDVPAEETIPFFEEENSVFQAPQDGITEHAVVVDSGELFALEEIDRPPFELFALPSRPLRRPPGSESPEAVAVTAREHPLASTQPTKTLSRLYREQGHDEEADHLDRQALGRGPSGKVAPPELRAVDFAPLRQLQAAPHATERKRLVVAGYLDRLKEARDVS